MAGPRGFLSIFSSNRIEPRSLPPPQSPSFFIREKEYEYELVEHGNEDEAGAYGKKKSEAVAYGKENRYSFERATGDEVATKRRQLLDDNRYI